jgi:hypothetical protein
MMETVVKRWMVHFRLARRPRRLHWAHRVYSFTSPQNGFQLFTVLTASRDAPPVLDYKKADRLCVLQSMCFIDSWLACVTPLLNRCARTLIQIGLYMNVVTLHASGSVQLQYSNRQYYIHMQARGTFHSMWLSLSQIFRYDGTWRKSWKRKSLRTWGFKSSRGHGVLPQLSASFFFVPLCGRLWTGIFVAHAEKATCVATCGRPTACRKRRACLPNYLCTVQFW